MSMMNAMLPTAAFQAPHVIYPGAWGGFAGAVFPHAFAMAPPFANFIYPPAHMMFGATHPPMMPQMAPLAPAATSKAVRTSQQPAAKKQRSKAAQNQQQSTSTKGWNHVKQEPVAVRRRKTPLAAAAKLFSENKPAVNSVDKTAPLAQAPLVKKEHNQVNPPAALYQNLGKACTSKPTAVEACKPKPVKRLTAKPTRPLTVTQEVSGQPDGLRCWTGINPLDFIYVPVSEKTNAAHGMHGADGGSDMNAAAINTADIINAADADAVASLLTLQFAR